MKILLYAVPALLVGGSVAGYTYSQQATTVEEPAPVVQEVTQEVPVETPAPIEPPKEEPVQVAEPAPAPASETPDWYKAEKDNENRVACLAEVEKIEKQIAQISDDEEKCKKKVKSKDDYNDEAKDTLTEECEDTADKMEKSAQKRLDAQKATCAQYL